MSGKSPTIQLLWVGKDVIAVTGGDLTIRLWDYESNHTFILPLPDIEEISFHSGAEHFSLLAFKDSILAAATNLGGIAFWRRDDRPADSEDDDNWHFIGFVGLSGGSILKVSWGFKWLYVHNATSLYQIQQQAPCTAYTNHVRQCFVAIFLVLCLYVFTLGGTCSAVLVCIIGPKRKTFHPV